LATANDKLRAARQRTGSPTHPDECLSRQELAELVNAWIWEHHHTVVEASANWVGKLEQGIIRWPSKLYREALRTIFSVPTDSALGFVNTRRAVVKLDDVKRKHFLETAALGMGTLALEGPLAALLEGGEPTPIPARVGATEINQIRSATRVFNSWSNTYGGGLARETVMTHLRYSASLLEASCPARLRPELYFAVGDFADTAGYMAVDADAHEQGRRVYGFALACAEQAKDWPLRAEVLSSTAKQALWTGQPDEALTLAEQALARADRLTPTVQALLHTDRARALAKMRRVQETLTAIGTADEHFAHATPDNDPPYIAYYSAAHHAHLTGRSLADLAILSRDPAQATDRLAAAVAGQPGHCRPGAMCLAKLASLTMVTGEPIHAASIGHAALDVAGTLRSRRAAEELRELSRYAAAHQQLEEVAHLRHRIATLVCTTSP
jgi:hypothetical protein